MVRSKLLPTDRDRQIRCTLRGVWIFLGKWAANIYQTSGDLTAQKYFVYQKEEERGKDVLE